MMIWEVYSINADDSVTFYYQGTDSDFALSLLRDLIAAGTPALLGDGS